MKLTPAEINNKRTQIRVAKQSVDLNYSEPTAIISEMQRLVDEYPNCTISIRVEADAYNGVGVDQYAVMSRDETDQEVIDRVSKQQVQLKERLAREIEEKQRQLSDLQRWV